MGQARPLSERLDALLFRPADIAALAVFRVLFGMLMAWDTLRHVFAGWVTAHYVEPTLLLKFVGFHWVKAFPPAGMYLVFALQFVAAFGIALGYHYRKACALFTLTHTYLFLVAAELYLNHAYLICLFSAVLLFLPAQEALSFDAERGAVPRRRTIPAWPYWAIIGLVGVVYTYGSIAKINPDWLAGEPVRHWLAQRAETASAPVAELLRSELATYTVSYFGLVFDMLVVPAMLWRPTRWLFMGLSATFHLSNFFLFDIGVFPWLMLAITTLFLDWDWPRRLPRYGEAMNDLLDGESDEADDAAPLTPYSSPPEPSCRRVRALLGAFFLVMIAVPLRHHLYPSDVAWSEEGHFFAWRMKLRDKASDFHLEVVDRATGERWTVYPEDQLNERQLRKAGGRPDLLVSYVHRLRDGYRAEGREVAIFAHVFVSLNFRPFRRLIDPTVDLARVERGLGPAPWILPFPDDPLPAPVPAANLGLGHAARTAARAALRAP